MGLRLKQRSLALYTDRAIAFTERVMKEVEDRHFGAHAIWDQFVQAANGHTIRPQF